MATLFTKGMQTLVDGQALSGVAAQPAVFRVSSGRVWLTIAGMRQDYWLRAGSTMVVPAGYLVVLESYGGEAKFEVAPKTRRAISWKWLKPRRVVTACVIPAKC